MGEKNNKTGKKIVLGLCVFLGIILVSLYMMQRYWAHREEHFYPDYARVVLTDESDYETIFLQTGLGRPAVDRLRAEGDFQGILDAQEEFWKKREVVCTPLLGWFTKEDRVNYEVAGDIKFADLQPGDILVTLSTHSLGWRHGHVALVLDEETTLESTVWGMDSSYGRVENWKRYSGFAVLRIKDVTPELQEQIVEYAQEELYGVPYHLTAGFILGKAPKTDAPYFGVQCAYLVWYAWNRFGYDLDSDGGRLVTAQDLLQSELLEVVQVYGMEIGGRCRE